jgi:hypothetical protein
MFSFLCVILQIVSDFQFEFGLNQNLENFSDRNQKSHYISQYLEENP